MIPKKNPKKNTENKNKEINKGNAKRNKLSTNLPKSEFTEAGIPILNIQGIDDTDLSSSMNDILKHIGE